MANLLYPLSLSVGTAPRGAAGAPGAGYSAGTGGGGFFSGIKNKFKGGGGSGAGSSRGSKPAGPPVLFTVEATFDFLDGNPDTDLSFKTGTIIQVTEAHDSGWWEGTLKGKTGLFPSTYVQKMDEPASGDESDDGYAPPAGKGKGASAGGGGGERMVKAVYDYDKEDDGELSIAEGDVLVVLEDLDGWIMCRNTASGEEGICPSNYTEPC